MNGASLIDLVLLAVAMAAVVWAMAERARAQRALGELEHASAGDEAIKAQAALSANAVADELLKRSAEALKPMGETLDKFEARVSAMEKARAEESGAFKTQLEALMAASTATQQEARRLAMALRSGAGVQGRWGEQMLRNVLELAGMKAGTDFFEQVHVDAGDKAQRPDVTVRLPGGGVFVIDAKCATTAYLEAQNAVDEASREAAYQRHAASLKMHMQTLATKAYWEQFEAAPDFVAMFIPGDAFLAAATSRNADLFTQAMKQRVILVTPSSLFALCKAVAYGWRVEAQARNARQIADLGRELYGRLSVMGGHVAGLGASLAKAVEKYNAFVGSLESRVMSQARKFEEYHADNPATPIAELAGIDIAPRKLADGPALTATSPTHTCGE